jgi:hypothetical protein
MNRSTTPVRDRNIAENRKYRRKHGNYRSRPRFLHYFVIFTFQNHKKSLLFSNLKFNKHSSCSTTKEIPLFQWNPKRSLSCSQELATGPHPEPDESSKQVYRSLKPVLILSFQLCLGFRCGLCFQDISVYVT